MLGTVSYKDIFVGLKNRIIDCLNQARIRVERASDEAAKEIVITFVQEL